MQTRFDYHAEVPSLDDLGRVHVLAAGGAGMSAVARLLHAAGARVSGSDQRESAVVEALRAEGIPVSIGHDPAQVAGVDTVVVSSAIREDNPELVAARAAGARVLHRSQGLAVALSGRRIAAVAGANGKTTTTSMLTEALRAAGVDPAYAIGGELVSTASNAGLGAPLRAAEIATSSAVDRGETDRGETGRAVAIVEADESDGSFLVYRPQVAIVTSVQPDHLDFYGDFAGVQAAYAEFVATIRPGGVLVACADDPGAAALAAAARIPDGRVITYGFGPDADVRLSEPEVDGLGQTVTLRGSGLDTVAVDGPTAAEIRMFVPMPGPHNALDAAAAFVAAVVGLEAPIDGVVRGLGDFAGVRRRFEIKGTARGVTVVDDYAHNPGKVAALVRTAAALVRAVEPVEPAPAGPDAGGSGPAGSESADGGRSRVIAVFQPHLYSRTSDFAAQFAEGLAPADEVVLVPIYGAREEPVPGVTSRLITDRLREIVTSGRVTPESVGGSDRGVHDVADLDEVPALVARLAGRGDLVLTIGAGDITRIGQPILDALRGTSVEGDDRGLQR